MEKSCNISPRTEKIWMMWKLLFSHLLILVHSQTSFRKGICLLQVGLFLKHVTLKSQSKQTSCWFLMDTSLRKRGYSVGINKKKSSEVPATFLLFHYDLSHILTWSHSGEREIKVSKPRGSAINCCMVGMQGYNDVVSLK